MCSGCSGVRSGLTPWGGPDFEGVAGIRNPSGGGVHEFQLFNPGSADRGERRLTALSSD